jgi:hypothetical protein
MVEFETIPINNPKETVWAKITERHNVIADPMASVIRCDEQQFEMPFWQVEYLHEFMHRHDTPIFDEMFNGLLGLFYISHIGAIENPDGTTEGKPFYTMYLMNAEQQQSGETALRTLNGMFGDVIELDKDEFDWVMEQKGVPQKETYG